MKEIGKIASVHGVAGDLVIVHQLSDPRKIEKFTVLMIEVWPGSFIPFFIEMVSGISHNDCCVKFEEINSREEARQFVGKKVLVFDAESLQTVNVQDWDYLKGYSIFDQTAAKIGIVDDIISFGKQLLIELSYNNKRVHLPLHADLVIEIDQKAKKISLMIPDGLLDI